MPQLSSPLVWLVFLEERKKLSLVLDSLLPQVDRLNIYLNYPKGESLPPICQTHPQKDKINLVHAGNNNLNDLYCNGKFYFLDQIDNGYIFTVDDDLVYPANYIKQSIAKIERYNRKCVVGTQGGILPSRVSCFYQERNLIHCTSRLDRDVFVNLIGTGVIGFHKSTINLSLHDFKTPNSADLWFSIVCQFQQIPIVCITKREHELLDLKYEQCLWSNRKRSDKIQTRLAQTVNWGVYLYQNGRVIEAPPTYRDKTSTWYRKYRKSVKSKLRTSIAYPASTTTNPTTSTTSITTKTTNPIKTIKTTKITKITKITKKILIYHNTKCHFEIMPSFIDLFLSKSNNDIYLYSQYLDQPRKNHLFQLFDTRLTLVKKVDYKLYDTVVYVTYYPDNFPRLERLKYVNRALKEANRLDKTKVILVCHDFLQI